LSENPEDNLYLYNQTKIDTLMSLSFFWSRESNYKFWILWRRKKLRLSPTSGVSTFKRSIRIDAIKGIDKISICKVRISIIWEDHWMWKNSEYKLEAMMTLSATLQPKINFGQSQASLSSIPTTLSSRTQGDQNNLTTPQGD